MADFAHFPGQGQTRKAFDFPSLATHMQIQNKSPELTQELLLVLNAGLIFSTIVGGTRRFDILAKHLKGDPPNRPKQLNKENTGVRNIYYTYT
ncbi:hypothetical protein N7522_002312 [Penicillium canescens]|nr:hypothetical protein N7522_002312 [Penicillium canescens]KAJ6154109.1 hypothetical protein N7485_012478 [Penicillium canescens]